jgi:DNA-binding CsgD family transcriptional regulator
MLLRTRTDRRHRNQVDLVRHGRYSRSLQPDTHPRNQVWACSGYHAADVQANEVTPRADDGGSLYRSIFVGRHSELQRLRTAFDEAISGRPSLIVLAGEPGIGKTALCGQLSRYIHDCGGLALWGVCPETDSPSLAYLPIVQALDAYMTGVDNEQLGADSGSGAPELARILPELRQRLNVRPRDPGDPGEDRWRLLQAVTGLLRNISTRRPTAIVLEDLHQADRGTLDLLVHLSQQIGDARLLLVGTYRDIEVDRTHPLSSTLADLRRSPLFARVALRGLTVPEVHDLYRRVRGQEVPLTRAEAVHHQTEGNPLFVQEVLRYLVEVGLVVRSDGAYVAVDGDRIEADVPEGLRDVVGKRLNRLSERTNEVLHIAAVIGREFRLDVLRRVSGMTDDAILESLEEAHARAIIEASGGYGALARFRFTHAYFRQTLYDEIFGPRRIRWHRLSAAVIEEVYAETLNEHAGELAAHYAHSSDSADLARALTYDELAAREAMRVSAYGECARHLERALQVENVLEPRAPLKRCDLLLDLGEAMLTMQQPARAVASVASEAFRLAESHADSPRAARAAVQALDALSRPWAPTSLPRTAEVHDWVARANQHAAAGSLERVYADTWAGILALATGRPSDVTAPLLRAVELARQLGDNRAYAAAAGFALTQVLALQDVDTVERLARQFQAHPHDGMRSADLAHCLWGVGRVLLGSGDRDAAERAWQELDALAAESRDPNTTLQALPNATLRAFVDGDLEKVLVQQEAEERFGAAVGIQAPNAISLLTRARALHYLGRATSTLLEGFRGETRPQMACRAFILALLGQNDEALSLRARFEGIDSEEDATARMLLALLLDVSIRCGDHATAAALVPRMAPHADRLDGLTILSYGRLVGEAAALLNRPDEARAYFEQALAFCEKVRIRPELALTRLSMAVLLLQSYPAERRRWAELLRLATADFEAMHMPAYLTRALELQDSVDARTPAGAARRLRSSKDDLDPLTEREREVATLISQGMSNREIAATLVISESTAEVHVKHVLSKLGLKSRAQVAVWAATRGGQVGAI